MDAHSENFNKERKHKTTNTSHGAEEYNLTEKYKRGVQQQTRQSRRKGSELKDRAVGLLPKQSQKKKRV